MKSDRKLKTTLKYRNEHCKNDDGNNAETKKSTINLKKKKKYFDNN